MFQINFQFVAAGTLGTAHVWIGLVVVILGTLNPIVAYFRPHPVEGEPKTTGRKMFELFHKYIIGWNAVVFGLVNILLAFLFLNNGEYSYNSGLMIFVGSVFFAQIFIALVIAVTWPCQSVRSMMWGWTGCESTKERGSTMEAVNAL